MDPSTERGVVAAAEGIQARLGVLAPRIGLVLGSGLGQLTERLGRPVRIPYAEVPGFPLPGVPGHAGELIGGELEGVPLICQSGRFHGYEGHSTDTVALPVRVFARLGVRVLVLTNAAGGIRRSLRPGSLMLVADQLNLTFRSVLAGPLVEPEERFPDMSDPYDPGLRDLARRTAIELGIALEEGVYAGVVGPSYETGAEIRLIAKAGADAVGMSTVLETIAARANGLRCLGISTITNLATGLGGPALSHDEVLRVGQAASRNLGALIARLVPRI
jgi:purine-nucleoside phosphorylase